MPASRTGNQKNMYRRSTGLLVAGLLLLWISALAQARLTVTQDCSVQILSVTLNKMTLSVGETLQVNVSYNLLYDPEDPLAIGVVTVSINVDSQKQPILTCEYGERGTGLRKTLSLSILSANWEPNETGQMGLVRVSGWVQDSYGSMTDYAERGFTIERGEARLTLCDVPSRIFFHDRFNLTARITNANNGSIVLDNHPVRIETSNGQRIVQTWDLNTLADGTFVQPIEADSLGTGTFTTNITSNPDGDYLQTSVRFSFDIARQTLLLVAHSNATAYLAYYPGMNNCTALLTASLACSSQIHDVSEANITWTLANREGALEYQGAQQFGGQVSMPETPGQYVVTLQASLPNHNSTATSLPLFVDPRRTILSLEANRTQAAYGDFIGLCVRVLDKGCSKPVAGKQVSVHVLVQANWTLLERGSLDDNGELMTVWQAQDVGNPREFCFKAVFEGMPEFTENETSSNVGNTRDARFVSASRVIIVRGKAANFTIQITTLESVPIQDLGVELVEVLTNQTWCSTTTNASGYALLVWDTPAGYELGEHRFLVVAADAAGTRGCIKVLLIVYEGTILKVV